VPYTGKEDKMAKNNKTVDRIQAVWNILGGEEGVDRLIRGEITTSEPERPWREQDGVIYFSVTSDGTTGEEWINRLESKGFCLGGYTKQLLHSDDFKPTDGVTYEIAVLKGMLFEDSNRVTKKVRSEAKGRGFITPNAEIACLIREKFSDEEIEALGLWLIVTMHEPIKDSLGDPPLLSARRRGGGGWFGVFYDNPDYRWRREHGFAFVVSQVSA